MNEDQPIFKVTDRRLFNADGSPREIEGKEETKAETTAGETQRAAPATESRAPTASQAGETAHESKTAQAASPAQATQRNPGAEKAGEATATNAPPSEAPEQFSEDDYAEREIPGADDPASFLNFLMSIASNAAAALGMMEHPVTGQRTVDPELAKHWIDVLGMLQQKTMGNLAPQEKQIFDGLLADLRMQYVSVSGASPPKAPRGFTGSDITGGR